MIERVINITELADSSRINKHGLVETKDCAQCVYRVEQECHWGSATTALEGFTFHPCRRLKSPSPRLDAHKVHFVRKDTALGTPQIVVLDKWFD